LGFYGLLTCTLGIALLALYEFSPANAITTVYPNVSWKRWNFTQHKSKQWWEELVKLFNSGDPVALVSVAEFVQDVINSHNIKEPSDWFAVELSTSSDYILSEYFKATLATVARKALPHLAQSLDKINWLSTNDSFHIQHELARNVQEIIPSAQINNFSLSWESSSLELITA